MTEERKNETPAVGQLQLSGRERLNRRGLLSRMNRFVGRLNMIAAALLVTSIAVVLAVLFNWALGVAGLIDFDRRILLASAIVTVLVGFRSSSMRCASSGN